MKTDHYILGLMLLLLAFSACNTGKEKNAGQPGDTTTGPPKYRPFEECPRGVPEPILNQKVFPDRKFRLDEVDGHAYESVVMTGNDSLVILHGGCEYIETSFRFYTNQPANAAAKLMLHKKAVAVLGQIIQGLKNPKDFMEGTKILSVQLKKGTLEVGKEYEFGVFEPGNFNRTVMLKDVLTMPNGRLRVTVDFKEGPL